MKNKHKILILTYDFPPQGGTSVQRIAKFTKYLPQFDWQPIVITASEKSGSSADTTLADSNGQKLKIIKVKPILSRQDLQKTRQNNALAYRWENQSRPKSLKARLALFTRDYFLIPDGRILWLVTVFLPLLRTVKAEKPELLLATGPPFSSFVIAWIVRLLKRTPYVLDYRDPWTQAFSGYRSTEPALRKKIELFLEKRAITAASLIAGTTQQILSYCRHLDKKPQEEKYIQIHNGFDHEDFDSAKPEQFDKFTVVYTGKIDTVLYDLIPFLRGLKIFIDGHPDIKKQLQFIFVGKFNHDDALNYIEQNGLSGVIKLVGFQPHSTCIALQKGAALLLLIGNRGYHDQWVIASKIFEYAAAQKPILAVIPDDCPTADIIRENGWGAVTEPGDDEGVASMLEKYINPSKEKRATQKFNIEQFTRRHQTGLLAEAMNKLL